MNTIRKQIVIFLALILPLSALSQQKLKLAIIDPVIAGEKLTDGLAISVREIVSSSFVNNADNYAIVERSLIDKVMQEAKFSNSDAVDESQATQLGKLAGADKVVLTVISRFDNRCMMSIKLIDVESATIDRQISKLVDLSSVLDVTEPLTMAVLGKGDANLIPSSTSMEGQNKQKVQSHSTQTTDGQKGNSIGSGIKNFFGRKNKETQPKQASVVQAANNSQVPVPEFSGTGINYMPIEMDIPPQSEEFNINYFNQIYNNNSFNIVIDFSNTRVMGMELLKYREIKSTSNEKVFGYDFFNRMNSEVGRFVKALNDETKLNFSYWPEAPVTLFVRVIDIDEPGRENLSDYVFIDTKTGDVLTGVRLKTKGGKFGSWTNLFGDALEEDAAPTISKKIKSAKKKYKKLFGK